MLGILTGAIAGSFVDSTLKKSQVAIDTTQFPTDEATDYTPLFVGAMLFLGATVLLIFKTSK